MIDLKNVTYVVNDARKIMMLASIFGCENGTDYVTCGTSSFTAGDPVLENIVQYTQEGRFDEMLPKVFSPAMLDQVRALKPLMLYGYQVPEYAVYYSAFTANPVFARDESRSFVLVCTRKSDMFAFAKFIEQEELLPKRCYVAFVDSFSKDDILDADSLMPFPELMSEYVDTLNDTGWRDDGKKRHFKDIVWLQGCLNMTNVQMAVFFGIKLRTIENWRSKPESMPDYAWYYFMQTCFTAKPYLEHRYGSDVNAVLADK